MNITIHKSITMNISIHKSIASTFIKPPFSFNMFVLISYVCIHNSSVSVISYYSQSIKQQPLQRPESTRLTVYNNVHRKKEEILDIFFWVHVCIFLFCSFVKDRKFQTIKSCVWTLRAKYNNSLLYQNLWVQERCEERNSYLGSLGIMSHRVLPGPFLCNLIVFPAVCLVDTSNVWHKRVIWIWISE